MFLEASLPVHAGGWSWRHGTFQLFSLWGWEEKPGATNSWWNSLLCVDMYAFSMGRVSPMPCVGIIRLKTQTLAEGIYFSTGHRLQSQGQQLRRKSFHFGCQMLTLLIKVNMPSSNNQQISSICLGKEQWFFTHQINYWPLKHSFMSVGSVIWFSLSYI